VSLTLCCHSRQDTAVAFGRYRLFVLIWTLVTSSVVRFRSKWRSERQRPRRQEYQDDVRDRQREADEQAALEKETEDLFKRQMDEMADIEAKGRAAGLLFEDAKPIKVAIGAPAPLLPSGTNASVATSSSVAAVKTETKPKVAAARGNAASAFGAEDDDEDVKKKRTLVRLDEDAGVKSNIEAKTQAKLTAIRNGIPKSPAELWSLKLRWEGLSSVRIAVVDNSFVSWA
jgi:RNA-binding protein 25